METNNNNVGEIVTEDNLKVSLNDLDIGQLGTALDIIKAEVTKRGRGRPRIDKPAKIATVRGLKIALSRAANSNGAKINEILVNEQDKTIKFSASGNASIQQIFQAIIAKNGYAIIQ